MKILNKNNVLTLSLVLFLGFTQASCYSMMEDDEGISSIPTLRILPSWQC